MKRRSFLTRIAALFGLGAVGRASTMDQLPGWTDEEVPCLNCPADRLWVGPSRQEWMERLAALSSDPREPVYHNVPYHCPMDPAAVGPVDGYIIGDGHRVVAGIDGKWRWTQDLGIPPR